MPIIYRGPPYDDGSSPTQPWGSGQGSALLEAQFDNNFYYLLTLIQDLQASQGAGISYFVINGNQMYVHLTNHQVLGPYTLPMWTPVPVGQWEPDTQYYSNNVVYYNGATYLVTYNHISPPSFNPYYEVGGNACYSPPILVSPGDVLPIGGQDGYLLTATSTGGSNPPNTAWLPPAFDYIATGHPVDGQFVGWNGSEWTNLDLPVATSSSFGVVEPDNSTITISGGVISAVSGSAVPGAIFGLALSPSANIFSPSQVLNIAAGQAADSTGNTTLALASFTKSLAGAWVAGSGSDGMGNGLTVANSTWYHVFLIDASGTPDIYFDTSASAANIPSGATLFRRIGSIMTTASGANILWFNQNGNDFLWAVPFVEISNTTVGSGGSNYTLAGSPLGVPVRARLWLQLAYQSLADAVGVGTVAQSSNGSPLTTTGYGFNITVATDVLTWQTDVWTDSSAEVYLQSKNANCNVYLNTEGWYDDRGQYGNP
jgi:hypothetical protein